MQSYAGFHMIREGEYLCVRGGRMERIRPWGDGAGAWVADGSGEWRTFEPKILISVMREVVAGARPVALGTGLAGRAGQVEAWRFLLVHWPAEVADAVAAFGEAQWPLLMMANRHGGPALDLIRSNAALARLVASRPEHAGTLLAARRREIAGAFGFPATESCVRILGRVSPAAATMQHIESLKRAFASGAGEPLRHLRRAGPCALAVLNHEALRDKVTQPLLARLGRAPVELLARIEDLGARARDLPLLRTPAELDEAWVGARRPLAPAAPARRRAPAARRTARVRSRGLTFPPPPLPDTKSILAIRTPADLRAEGRAMGHCAGSYVRQVGPARYFYRMLAPERATICIRLDGGRWVVQEAKGPGNRLLSADANRAIASWLREAQSGAAA